LNVHATAQRIDFFYRLQRYSSEVFVQKQKKSDMNKSSSNHSSRDDSANLQPDRKQQARERRRREREGVISSPRLEDGGEQSEDNLLHQSNVDLRRHDREFQRRKRREADRLKRRVRRSSSREQGDTTMTSWTRGGAGPSTSRRKDGIDDHDDDLLANNRDARNARSSHSTCHSSNKRGSKIAAIVSGHDIDDVIAQFRNHFDVHMATLLELKNSINTTEKEMSINIERETEFQQVRAWYSELAEKHTKLQKEHQDLQAEHVALQQKYLNLKGADSDPNFQKFALTQQIVAPERIAGIGNSNNFVQDGGKAEKKKKKEKRDKSVGSIVWSRAA